MIQQIIDQIEDLFIGMGYQVLSGPEVEEDKYNFEMMNLPKDHPARDMQDTFYITKEILMRTQTSPMQARTLEKHDFSKGPLKMISPGVVYRRDTDDPTHSHQFHQVEGIVIDKHITMADLKGTLELIAHELFGDRFDIRLRPSYFPFTEPSVEADITCFNCGGKGCAVCKYTLDRSFRCWYGASKRSRNGWGRLRSLRWFRLWCWSRPVCNAEIWCGRYQKLLLK